jgi:hypothetical protein
LKPPGVVPRVQLADNLSVSKVCWRLPPSNSLCGWPMLQLHTPKQLHTHYSY